MIAAVKLRLLAEDIEAVVRRDRELGKRMKIPPTIPFDRAQWFITAVWAYLSGEAKTLDRAMGLSVGSGPPKIDRPDDEVYERSRRAWEMRIFENKSWKEVADELADEFPQFDENSLREGVERHSPYILAAFLEKHAARLKPDPHSNPAEARASERLTEREVE
jgi:hypothetical protein